MPSYWGEIRRRAEQNTWEALGQKNRGTFMVKAAAVGVAGAIMVGLGYLNVAKDFMIVTGSIFFAFSILALVFFVIEFFKAPTLRDNERLAVIGALETQLNVLGEKSKPKIIYEFGRAGMREDRAFGLMIKNVSSAAIENIEALISNVKFEDGRPLQNIVQRLVSIDGIAPPLKLNPGAIKYFQIGRRRKSGMVVFGPFASSSDISIQGDPLLIKVRITGDGIEPITNTIKLSGTSVGA